MDSLTPAFILSLCCSCCNYYFIIDVALKANLSTVLFYLKCSLKKDLCRGHYRAHGQLPLGTWASASEPCRGLPTYWGTDHGKTELKTVGYQGCQQASQGQFPEHTPVHRYTHLHTDIHRCTRTSTQVHLHTHLHTDTHAPAYRCTYTCT